MASTKGPWDDGPWGSGDPSGRDGRPRPTPVPDDRAGGPEEPRNPWGAPPDEPSRPRPWPPVRPGNRSSPEFDRALAAARAWLGRVLPPGGPPGRGPGRGPGQGGPGRGGPRRPGSPWEFGPGRSLALAALVLVVGWLGSGLFRVQPDEQGVVLRFGAFDRTVGPGLNYHLPWPVERALLPAVTRINRIEIGYRGGDAASAAPPEDSVEPSEGGILPSRLRGRAPGVAPRDLAEESLMLTGDENIIDINFAVFWRISDARAFLFNARNPERTVRSAAESVMREVIGRTPIQSALTQGRANIEQSVTTGAQAILDQYGAGVEITQVQLQKVDPPAAVIESFRDVQRANTDADRMRNEAQAYANDIVPRARGDAAAVVAGADAQRQAAVAAATGAAQRFGSVDAAYRAAPAVTLQRLYIEAMQDVLSRTPVTVVDGGLRGVVPLLPLTPGGLPGLPAAATPAPAAGAAK